MANSILSATDIANYAPELDLSQYSTATISGMASQATNRAVQFCSVNGFDQVQEIDEMDKAYISNDGELVVSVRRRPIVTIQSVSLVKGGFSTSLNLTGADGNPLYQIPSPRSKFVFPNSYFYLTGTYLAGGSSQLYTLRGAKVFYKMTYTAGYSPIPDDLKFAVILYFRDIVAQAKNPQGLQGFTQGSYSEQYGSNAEGKSKLVLQAEDALRNGGYVRTEW